MALSKDVYLILGALTGVASVYILPCSMDMKNDEKKDVGTNTSDQNFNNSTKRKDKKNNEKSTINHIVNSVVKKLKKWYCGEKNSWKIIIPTEDNSIYHTAQSSFQHSTTDTVSANPSGLTNSNITSSTDSTIYRKLSALNDYKQSSSVEKFKESLKEIYAGILRSGTSRNDSICRDFPRQSTLKESTMKNLKNISDNPKASKESTKSSTTSMSDKSPFSTVARLFTLKKKGQNNSEHSIMEANEQLGNPDAKNNADT